MVSHMIYIHPSFAFKPANNQFFWASFRADADVGASVKVTTTLTSDDLSTTAKKTSSSQMPPPVRKKGTLTTTSTSSSSSSSSSASKENVCNRSRDRGHVGKHGGTSACEEANGGERRSHKDSRIVNTDTGETVSGRRTRQSDVAGVRNMENDVSGVTSRRRSALSEAAGGPKGGEESATAKLRVDQASSRAARSATKAGGSKTTSDVTRLSNVTADVTPSSSTVVKRVASGVKDRRSASPKQKQSKENENRKQKSASPHHCITRTDVSEDRTKSPTGVNPLTSPTKSEKTSPVPSKGPEPKQNGASVDCETKGPRTIPVAEETLTSQTLTSDQRKYAPSPEKEKVDSPTKEKTKDRPENAGAKRGVKQATGEPTKPRKANDSLLKKQTSRLPRRSMETLPGSKPQTRSASSIKTASSKPAVTSARKTASSGAPPPPSSGRATSSSSRLVIKKTSSPESDVSSTSDKSRSSQSSLMSSTSSSRLRAQRRESTQASSQETTTRGTVRGRLSGTGANKQTSASCSKLMTPQQKGGKLLPMKKSLSSSSTHSSVSAATRDSSVDSRKDEDSISVVSTLSVRSTRSQSSSSSTYALRSKTTLKTQSQTSDKRRTIDASSTRVTKTSAISVTKQKISKVSTAAKSEQEAGTTAESHNTITAAKTSVETAPTARGAQSEKASTSLNAAPTAATVEGEQPPAENGEETAKTVPQDSAGSQKRIEKTGNQPVSSTRETSRSKVMTEKQGSGLKTKSTASVSRLKVSGSQGGGVRDRSQAGLSQGTGVSDRTAVIGPAGKQTKRTGPLLTRPDKPGVKESQTAARESRTSKQDSAPKSFPDNPLGNEAAEKIPSRLDPPPRDDSADSGSGLNSRVQGISDSVRNPPSRESHAPAELHPRIADAAARVGKSLPRCGSVESDLISKSQSVLERARNREGVKGEAESFVGREEEEGSRAIKPSPHHFTLRESGDVVSNGRAPERSSYPRRASVESVTSLTTPVVSPVRCQNKSLTVSDSDCVPSRETRRSTQGAVAEQDTSLIGNFSLLSELNSSTPLPKNVSALDKHSLLSVDIAKFSSPFHSKPEISPVQAAEISPISVGEITKPETDEGAEKLPPQCYSETTSNDKKQSFQGNTVPERQTEDTDSQSPHSFLLYSANEARQANSHLPPALTSSKCDSPAREGEDDNNIMYGSEAKKSLLPDKQPPSAKPGVISGGRGEVNSGMRGQMENSAPFSHHTSGHFANDSLPITAKDNSPHGLPTETDSGMKRGRREEGAGFSDSVERGKCVLAGQGKSLTAGAGALDAATAAAADTLPDDVTRREAHVHDAQSDKQTRRLLPDNEQTPISAAGESIPTPRISPESSSSVQQQQQGISSPPSLLHRHPSLSQGQQQPSFPSVADTSCRRPSSEADSKATRRSTKSRTSVSVRQRMTASHPAPSSSRPVSKLASPSPHRPKSTPCLSSARPSLSSDRTASRKSKTSVLTSSFSSASQVNKTGAVTTQLQLSQRGSPSPTCLVVKGRGEVAASAATGRAGRKGERGPAAKTASDTLSQQRGASPHRRAPQDRREARPTQTADPSALSTLHHHPPPPPSLPELNNGPTPSGTHYPPTLPVCDSPLSNYSTCGTSTPPKLTDGSFATTTTPDVFSTPLGFPTPEIFSTPVGKHAYSHLYSSPTPSQITPTSKSVTGHLLTEEPSHVNHLNCNCGDSSSSTISNGTEVPAPELSESANINNNNDIFGNSRRTESARGGVVPPPPPSSPPPPSPLPVGQSSSVPPLSSLTSAPPALPASSTTLSSSACPSVSVCGSTASDHPPSSSSSTCVPVSPRPRHPPPLSREAVNDLSGGEIESGEYGLREQNGLELNFVTASHPNERASKLINASSVKVTDRSSRSLQNGADVTTASQQHVEELSRVGDIGGPLLPHPLPSPESSISCRSPGGAATGWGGGDSSSSSSEVGSLWSQRFLMQVCDTQADLTPALGHSLDTMSSSASSGEMIFSPSPSCSPTAVATPLTHPPRSRESGVCTRSETSHCAAVLDNAQRFVSGSVVSSTSQLASHRTEHVQFVPALRGDVSSVTSQKLPPPSVAVSSSTLVTVTPVSSSVSVATTRTQPVETYTSVYRVAIAGSQQRLDGRHGVSGDAIDCSSRDGDVTQVSDSGQGVNAVRHQGTVSASLGQASVTDVSKMNFLHNDDAIKNGDNSSPKDASIKSKDSARDDVSEKATIRDDTESVNASAPSSTSSKLTSRCTRRAESVTRTRVSSKKAAGPVSAKPIAACVQDLQKMKQEDQHPSRPVKKPVTLTSVRDSVMKFETSSRTKVLTVNVRTAAKGSPSTVRRSSSTASNTRASLMTSNLSRSVSTSRKETSSSPGTQPSSTSLASETVSKAAAVSSGKVNTTPSVVSQVPSSHILTSDTNVSSSITQTKDSNLNGVGSSAGDSKTRTGETAVGKLQDEEIAESGALLLLLSSSHPESRMSEILTETEQQTGMNVSCPEFGDKAEMRCSGINSPPYRPGPGEDDGVGMKKTHEDTLGCDEDSTSARVSELSGQSGAHSSLTQECLTRGEDAGEDAGERDDVSSSPEKTGEEEGQADNQLILGYEQSSDVVSAHPFLPSPPAQATPLSAPSSSDFTPLPSRDRNGPGLEITTPPPSNSDIAPELPPARNLLPVADDSARAGGGEKGGQGISEPTRHAAQTLLSNGVTLDQETSQNPDASPSLLSSGGLPGLNSSTVKTAGTVGEEGTEGGKREACSVEPSAPIFRKHEISVKETTGETPATKKQQPYLESDPRVHASDDVPTTDTAEPVGIDTVCVEAVRLDHASSKHKADDSKSRVKRVSSPASSQRNSSKSRVVQEAREKSKTPSPPRPKSATTSFSVKRQGSTKSKPTKDPSSVRKTPTSTTKSLTSSSSVLSSSKKSARTITTPCSEKTTTTTTTAKETHSTHTAATAARREEDEDRQIPTQTQECHSGASGAFSARDTDKTAVNTISGPSQVNAANAESGARGVKTSDSQQNVSDSSLASPSSHNNELDKSAAFSAGPPENSSSYLLVDTVILQTSTCTTTTTTTTTTPPRGNNTDAKVESKEVKGDSHDAKVRPRDSSVGSLSQAVKDASITSETQPASEQSDISSVRGSYGLQIAMPIERGDRDPESDGEFPRSTEVIASQSADNAVFSTSQPSGEAKQACASSSRVMENSTAQLPSSSTTHRSTENDNGQKVVAKWKKLVKTSRVSNLKDTLSTKLTTPATRAESVSPPPPAPVSPTPPRKYKWGREGGVWKKVYLSDSLHPSDYGVNSAYDDISSSISVCSDDVEFYTHDMKEDVTKEDNDDEKKENDDDDDGDDDKDPPIDFPSVLAMSKKFEQESGNQSQEVKPRFTCKRTAEGKRRGSGDSVSDRETALGDRERRGADHPPALTKVGSQLVTHDTGEWDHHHHHHHHHPPPCDLLPPRGNLSHPASVAVDHPRPSDKIINPAPVDNLHNGQIVDSSATAVDYYCGDSEVQRIRDRTITGHSSATVQCGTVSQNDQDSLSGTNDDTATARNCDLDCGVPDTDRSQDQDTRRQHAESSHVGTKNTTTAANWQQTTGKVTVSGDDDDDRDVSLQAVTDPSSPTPTPSSHVSNFAPTSLQGEEGRRRAERREGGEEDGRPQCRGENGDGGMAVRERRSKEAAVSVGKNTDKGADDALGTDADDSCPLKLQDTASPPEDGRHADTNSFSPTPACQMETTDSDTALLPPNSGKHSEKSGGGIFSASQDDGKTRVNIPDSVPELDYSAHFAPSSSRTRGSECLSAAELTTVPDTEKRAVRAQYTADPDLRKPSSSYPPDSSVHVTRSQHTMEVSSEQRKQEKSERRTEEKKAENATRSRGELRKQVAIRDWNSSPTLTRAAASGRDPSDTTLSNDASGAGSRSPVPTRLSEGLKRLQKSRDTPWGQQYLQRADRAVTSSPTNMAASNWRHLVSKVTRTAQTERDTGEKGTDENVESGPPLSAEAPNKASIVCSNDEVIHKSSISDASAKNSSALATASCRRELSTIESDGRNTLGQSPALSAMADSSTTGDRISKITDQEDVGSNSEERDDKTFKMDNDKTADIADSDTSETRIETTFSKTIFESRVPARSPRSTPERSAAASDYHTSDSSTSCAVVDSDTKRLDTSGDLNASSSSSTSSSTSSRLKRQTARTKISETVIERQQNSDESQASESVVVTSGTEREQSDDEIRFGVPSSHHQSSSSSSSSSPQRSGRGGTSAKLISMTVWDTHDGDKALRGGSSSAARRVFWDLDCKELLAGISEQEEQACSPQDDPHHPYLPPAATTTTTPTPTPTTPTPTLHVSRSLQATPEKHRDASRERDATPTHPRRRRTTRRSLSLPTGSLSYGDVKISYRDGHFVTEPIDGGGTGRRGG
ncbi:hypothetical protein ACOMHN_028924 [Nucella lapillus]